MQALDAKNSSKPALKERAYSVLVDESNVNKWMPTLRKIENVSGAPLEVGSKQ
jgi:hypothetical protein